MPWPLLTVLVEVIGHGRQLMPFYRSLILHWPMTNFNVYESKVRTLRPGDKHFQIQDVFTVANRAGFEIDAKCPPTYQNIIALCYSRGWLKPIANVTEREMIFMGLTDGS